MEFIPIITKQMTKENSIITVNNLPLFVFIFLSTIYIFPKYYAYGSISLKLLSVKISLKYI